MLKKNVLFEDDFNLINMFLFFTILLQGVVSGLISVNSNKNVYDYCFFSCEGSEDWKIKL